MWRDVAGEVAELFSRLHVPCGDGHGTTVRTSLLLHDPHAEADAFIAASPIERESVRQQCKEKLARLIAERGAEFVAHPAYRRLKRAAQAKARRARLAVAAGRKPGVTGRPRAS